MTAEEAALIMMSGGGGGTTSDSRIKKLEEAPIFHEFLVGDGWSVKVKIADDIDNMQDMTASLSTATFTYYQKWDTIYYCVYCNGIFKYAIGKTNFHVSYRENYYDDGDYEEQKWDKYICTSAKLIMYGGNLIYTTISGTVTQTYHGINADGTTWGPNTSEEGISDSFSRYSGESGTVMIFNDGVDFKTTYQDFYAACKKYLPTS